MLDSLRYGFRDPALLERALTHASTPYTGIDPAVVLNAEVVESYLRGRLASTR